MDQISVFRIWILFHTLRSIRHIHRQKWLVIDGHFLHDFESAVSSDIFWTSKWSICSKGVLGSCPFVPRPDTDKYIYRSILSIRINLRQFITENYDVMKWKRFPHYGPVTSGFHHQWTVMWCLPWCLPGQSFEQTFGVSVLWDAMAVMWRNINANVAYTAMYSIISTKKSLQPDVNILQRVALNNCLHQIVSSAFHSAMYLFWSMCVF